jgi:hypothetical protein
MSRRRDEEKLSKLLDGELDAGEAEALLRRAAGDSSLEQSKGDWQRIGRMLRETPVVGGADPEVVWADVRRAIRIAGEEAAPAAPAWRLRWAVGAVAAVCMAIVGLGAWRILHFGAAPALARGEPAVVEWVEAELPGASPMVFEDAETGCTVIWMVVAEENGAGQPATSQGT